MVLTAYSAMGLGLKGFFFWKHDGSFFAQRVLESAPLGGFEILGKLRGLGF